MQKDIVVLFKGVVMGIAEIIPGVSGSTLALIMGIYRKFISLLHKISNVMKEIIKLLSGRSSLMKVKHKILEIDFKFGTLLLLGMLIGIGGFSHVMSFLLENYPQYTFAFFFGLILASVSIPWKQMSSRSTREFLILLITFTLFMIILGLKPVGEIARPHFAFLFMGGFLAICAMVLPGVSGSFILLLLGLYHHIVEIVKSITSLDASLYELMELGMVLLGIVVGFGLFVRLLNHALEKYHDQLMAFLVGLMFASLRVLWPFMDTASSDTVENMRKILPWQTPFPQTILILVFISVSLVLVQILNKVNSKKPVRNVK